MGKQPSASSGGAGAEQLRRRNLSTLLGHVHLVRADVTIASSPRSRD